MFRQLLHRPIAVSMVLIAITAVGILALTYIPVSLMPEIDIPRITVQLSNPGASVTEVEQQMVTPLRYQLSQVAGLKDIETQSKMDAGSITLKFEPGSDMDLLFIDVNEKIDRAMNNMPKDMSRPKVIKASAMDIPAFYIDVTQKATAGDMGQLSRLVRNVITKRIEQLPQTAMVDYSGTVGGEIDIVPDVGKTQALGITSHDLETAINDNNLVIEALSVVSGIYRYSIHFDSQILTKQDIENVYLQHEGRLLQLKDICDIEEKTGVRNGIVRHNGKDAVTIAVIKQNDAQMADLQKSIKSLIEDLQRNYPDLEFSITRDQTELLSYSVNNLEWNLILGAVLACLILFVFNGGWRIPLLVIISMPLSLIFTILCFYVTGISLNVISLSGLILGIGMIVDNSIIVIDNIRQRGNIVNATREVFVPMLSSVLTTCSVFLPLIFLSGTAGALFYDQAMGVTFALFASLIVAAIVVPVYYYVLFKKKSCNQLNEVKAEKLLIGVYEPGMRWTLRHGKLCMAAFVLCFVIIAVVYPYIKKERMPYIEQKDALMNIDWNAGITAEENDRRVQELLNTTKGLIETNTAMVGVQQFILSHTKDITNNEAVVYIKTNDEKSLDSVKTIFSDYLKKHYSNAKMEFGISGNIYDLIFQTDKPDLEIRLQKTEGGRPSVDVARLVVDSVRKRFPDAGIQPVPTENVLRYIANPEQLALYHISYSQLYSRLKEIVGSYKVFGIAAGDQSIPVIVCQGKTNAAAIMQKTVRNNDGIDVPLQYVVKETKAENFKRLNAGLEGEYYSIVIKSASDKNIKSIVDYVEKLSEQKFQNLKCSFHGNYYDSRKMIQELAMVLCVALLLLYFILAAQFESLIQPAIILAEIVIDVCIVLLALWAMGESVNIMSMIGLVVMSGIIINDSILKVDTINNLYRHGKNSLLRSIIVAGQMRLRPIVMTSLTTILALVPFLNKNDMGSALQFPLSVTIVIGMIVGTAVSLFFVPLLYFIIYRWKERGSRRQLT